MAYTLHYAPDNASLIIRLALEELNLPYSTVLVNRALAEHKSPAFLKLNPNGLIPVLETETQVLFETGAILLWLADTHKALAPMPDDPDRGRFLTWLFFTSNTMHSDLRKRFYPQQYVGDDSRAANALNTKLIDRLLSHLVALEAEAAKRPSWMSSDRPSILTIYLSCLLRWIQLFPIEADKSWFRLASYPNLKAILQNLETRASTKRAQLAEGLGPNPFSRPKHANPPEGSAI